jgi:copper chaperone CopZ
VRALDGVEDVEIDSVSMELIVSRDGSKVKLEDVVEAVRAAGFGAQKK